MTRAEAGRKGGLARARQFTPEYQAWARSHVSSEACRENGRKGYAVTKQRHGMTLAMQRAREYRLAHPSAPERRVLELLTEIGASTPEREYEEPFGEATVWIDFAWPDRMLAVEVEGRVHRLPELDPGRAQWDARRRQILADAGWTVLVLRDDELETARERLIAFLGLEDSQCT